MTGRVVVFGLAGGDATISSFDLVYRHQVHVIGLNIGILIQSAPQLFGAVMADMFSLIAAGVLGQDQPTIHPLADGARALTDLAARVTTGRHALTP